MLVSQNQSQLALKLILLECWWRCCRREKIQTFNLHKNTYIILFKYEKKILTWLCYIRILLQFSSVQSLSPVWLLATLWITAQKASLSITNSQSSLRLTSIESVMPSSHLILCHTLLLPPLPASGSFHISPSSVPKIVLAAGYFKFCEVNWDFIKIWSLIFNLDVL